MSYPQKTLTANQDYPLDLGPGEYSLMLGGSFGGGTVSVTWFDGDNTPVEYPSGSFTSAGGLIIAVGAARVLLRLTGATSPSITVRVAKVSG